MLISCFIDISFKLLFSSTIQYPFCLKFTFKFFTISHVEVIFPSISSFIDHIPLYCVIPSSFINASIVFDIDIPY